MKLSNYKNEYYVFSGLASSVNRQLGFAGIALLWLFKINKNGFYQLPHDLYWPAILLITGLGFDLIQYVLASIIWGLFFRFEEKKRKSVDEDPDIEAPKYFPWPINVFFVLKILSVSLAYIFLFKYVAAVLRFI